jgi:16S rRNA (adenine1518-N6/adenine1519-N6)-dimethyltransferase
VTSSVIRLTPHSRPPVKLDDEHAFFEFVRSCFAKRRKMLRAVLKQQYKWPEAVLSGVTAVDLSRRAETLSLEDFVTLYNYLKTDL